MNNLEELLEKLTEAVDALVYAEDEVKQIKGQIEDLKTDIMPLMKMDSLTLPKFTISKTKALEVKKGILLDSVFYKEAKPELNKEAVIEYLEAFNILDGVKLVDKLVIRKRKAFRDSENV